MPQTSNLINAGSSPAGEADSTPTLADLRAECHRLIDQIARQPRAIVLLLGIRNQCRMFAQYKATRSHEKRRR